MDELLEQFLIEGHELVQQASDDLLAWEKAPGDAALIDSAFRAVHTLKGSVGLFDLKPMGDVLHAAEDLLGALREKRAASDSAAIDLLLSCVSQSERWLDSIASTGGLLPDAPAQSLRLTAALRLQLNAGVDAAENPVGAQAHPDWAETLRALARSADESDGPMVAIRYQPHPECFFSGDDPIQFVRAIAGLAALRVSPREPWNPTTDFEVFRCNLVIEALALASKSDVQAIFRLLPDQVEIVEVSSPLPAKGQRDPEGGSESASGLADAARASRSLRVDASRIDALVDLVGELFVAKNGLAHLAAQAEAGVSGVDLARGIAASQTGLDRLVGELHRALMDARMAPLSSTLRRFPRLVREIAGQLGKHVLFSSEGDGLEADKSVVDGLLEPLVHVIRNAIDHGVEDAPVRHAAGKPARGVVTLKAHQSGDEIILDVTDDGAGIHPATIRRVAESRGLLSGTALDALSDAAVTDLIFAPGFSTARTVTEVSGRGVGMDAVRSAVQKLGGRVAISSTPGTGTTVRLSVPVTVALTRVLIVRLGDERFGVPMQAVAETVRLARDRVVPIRDGEAFVLRDRTLPLLRLRRLLGLSHGDDLAGDLTVLVVPQGESRVGVAVDGCGERVDLVLRPLDGLLSTLPGIAGTSVMGDGQVLLALNLPELIA